MVFPPLHENIFVYFLGASSALPRRFLGESLVKNGLTWMTLLGLAFTPLQAGVHTGYDLDGNGLEDYADDDGNIWNSYEDWQSANSFFEDQPDETNPDPEDDPGSMPEDSNSEPDLGGLPPENGGCQRRRTRAVKWRTQPTSRQRCHRKSRSSHCLRQKNRHCCPCQRNGGIIS